MTVLDWFLVILLVFYLYTLARWQSVQRKACYLFGVGGLMIALLGQIFLAWQATVVVTYVLNIFGAVVALGSAVAVYYHGHLPMVDEMEHRVTENLEHGAAMGGL
jgi:hypothetical protein